MSSADGQLAYFGGAHDGLPDSVEGGIHGVGDVEGDDADEAGLGGLVQTRHGVLADQVGELFGGDADAQGDQHHRK